MTRSVERCLIARAPSQSPIRQPVEVEISFAVCNGVYARVSTFQDGITSSVAGDIRFVSHRLTMYREVLFLKDLSTSCPHHRPLHCLQRSAVRYVYNIYHGLKTPPPTVTIAPTCPTSFLPTDSVPATYALSDTNQHTIPHIASMPSLRCGLPQHPRPPIPVPQQESRDRAAR
jgi:hypothetical protein